MTQDSLQGRLVWYEKILQLNTLIQNERSIETIFSYLMDDAIEASRAERGYIFLLEGNRISVLIARDQDKQAVDDSLNQISETVIRKLLELKAPLIISDASVDPDLREQKSVVALKLRSILCIPLCFAGKIVGILYLENRDHANFFRPELIEILSIFGTQASAVINTRKNEIQSLKQKKKHDEVADVGVAEFESAAKSKGMREVIALIDKVADSEASILITGETGTGKERVAQLIHHKSQRRKGPFVPVNCGAIPENLLESEFFGYVKGAFTGANDTREGLIHRANNGSLFLDEIGDLPLHLQVKLLRVLQEGEVQRVGATTIEKINLRVVSATNKDLSQEVRCERFRQDLFFRINNLEIHVPPLRERIEDFEYLLNYFVRRSSQEFGKAVDGCSPEAMAKLLKYAWPGNVRELENIVRRAVILADVPILGPGDFEFVSELAEPVDSDGIQSLSKAKTQFVKDYIKKAILINRGNKTRAAKALGVDPRTLYRHLSAEEIDD